MTSETPPLEQDSNMIWRVADRIKRDLDGFEDPVDDATKAAACRVVAELYQQTITRDAMVASMVQMLGGGRQ